MADDISPDSNQDITDTASPSPQLSDGNDKGAVRPDEGSRDLLTSERGKNINNFEKNWLKNNGKHPENAIGMCLSGGGVRSAMFNWGLLQAISGKGLLKGIDYLSTVSGGGYAAGRLYAAHLKQHQNVANPAANDHLGVNESGKLFNQTDPIYSGNILSNFYSMSARYCSTMVPIFLLHICALGVLFTIAALFWRSYDLQSYRDVYIAFGFLRYGNELAIAFLPALLMGSLWANCSVAKFLASRWARASKDNTLVDKTRIALFPTLLTLIYAACWLLVCFPYVLAGLMVPFGWSNNFSSQIYGTFLFAFVYFLIPFLYFICAFRTEWGELAEQYQTPNPAKKNRFLKFCFVLFLLFLAISSAVFLGNTETRVDSGGALFNLQGWVPLLTFLAALSQAIPLLTSKSMVDSTREEGPSWRKIFGNSVAYLAILAPCFMFTYFMAREDISGFSKHRNPDFEVKDIEDWNEFATLLTKWPLNEPSRPTGPIFEQLKRYFITLLFGNGQGDLVAREKYVSSLGVYNQSLYRLRFGAEGNTTVVEMPSWDTWQKTGPYAWLLPNDNNDSYAINFSHPVVQSFLAIFTADSDLETFSNRQQELDAIKRQIAELASQQLGTDLLTMKLLWEVRNRTVDRGLVLSKEFERPENQPFISRFLYGNKNTEIQNRIIDLSQRGTTDESVIKEHLVNFIFPSFWKDMDAYVENKLTGNPAGPNFQKLNDVEAQKVRLAWQRASLPFRTLIAKQRMISPSSQLDPQRDQLSDLVDLEAITVNQGRRVEEIKADNRALLTLLYPEIIKRQQFRSTYLLAAHDQWTRFKWLGIFAVSLLALQLVDINHLNGLYRFYRSSLNRVFLYPSTKSNPVRLSELKTECDKHSEEAQWLPYPIFNASLVRRLQHECDSTTQLIYSHFEFTPDRVGGPGCGYCSTEKYLNGEFDLADTIAISGSAFVGQTPNIFLSWLLSMFNLRLGQWLPNPSAGETFVKSKSTAYPWRIFCELGYDLGVHDLFKNKKNEQDWKFGLVADGGFHDFLGIGSLLERRCKIIIASDAGAQSGVEEFGSLAAAVKLARTQDGIKFLDLDNEKPLNLERFRRRAKHSSQSQTSKALRHDQEQTSHDQEQMIDRQVPQQIIAARIKYPESGSEGLFVYLPMSLCGDEDVDLLQFQKKYPQFPDEHITDQFFTPAQVEAYRSLGFHIGTKLCWDKNSLSKQAPHWKDRFEQIETALLNAYYNETWREKSYDNDDISPQVVTGTVPHLTSDQQQNQQADRLDINEEDPVLREIRNYEDDPSSHLKFAAGMIASTPFPEADREAYLYSMSRGFSKKHDRFYLPIASIAMACNEMSCQYRPEPRLKVGGRRELAKFCKAFEENALLDDLIDDLRSESPKIFGSVFKHNADASAKLFLKVIKDLSQIPVRA